MKIYLETSIFNRYFDVDPILHPATVQLFKEIKAGKFESYTSIFVIRELEEAPIEKNLKMRDIIPKFNIKILFETPKTLDFADLYMENNIISSRYLMDARHIAISVVNNLDKIISLNFKNIVRDKTKFFTDYICRLHGYKSIAINSPMEVIDYE